MKNKYFTIVALEEGQAHFESEGFLINQNGSGWVKTPPEAGSFEVEAGDELMIASEEDNDLITAAAAFLTFRTTFMYKVEGNIMSLSYGHQFRGKTEIQTEKEFSELFMGDDNLISAEDLVLPATDLADDCYAFMFNGCSNLVRAPKVLPAKVLADNCYYNMFGGCSSLTTTPKLPATTLAERCYAYMFYGCKALVKAPALPATELEEGCYYNMFSDCTSLVKPPKLPATELAIDCYNYMFNDCFSLQEAPDLPAETLVEDCYKGMFQLCINLRKAPSELPCRSVVNGCMQGMFAGCTKLTELPATPYLTGDAVSTAGCMPLYDKDY